MLSLLTSTECVDQIDELCKSISTVKQAADLIELTKKNIENVKHNFLLSVKSATKIYLQDNFTFPKDELGRREEIYTPRYLCHQAQYDLLIKILKALEVREVQLSPVKDYKVHRNEDGYIMWSSFTASNGDIYVKARSHQILLQALEKILGKDRACSSQWIEDRSLELPFITKIRNNVITFEGGIIL